MELDRILDRYVQSGALSRDDIVCLLKLDSREDVQRLLKAGDEVRRECVGDEVHVRALIEFSNVCVRHCNYCGLRAPNTKIKRYRVGPEEIVARAHT
jgi:biotin synthase